MKFLLKKMKKILKVNNKIVGELDEDSKIFTKKVKRSRHLYGTKSRDPLSWGIDGDIFNKYLLPENYVLIVEDSEEKVTYMTRSENMREKGFWRTFGNYKSQIFLSLEFWDKIEK